MTPRIGAVMALALTLVLPAAGPVSAHRAPAPPFRWPVAAPVVVRPFEPPPQRWSPGHRGVDLAVPPRSVVLAAAAGVVAHAGPVAGRPVVSIEHPGGLRTTYEPVEPTVRVGEVVAAGTVVGIVRPGHAGCPASACLHWGLRDGETYLDPVALVAPARVRLLPARR